MLAAGVMFHPNARDEAANDKNCHERQCRTPRRRFLSNASHPEAVFKDRLGLDVTVSGELEVDEYAVGAPIAAVRPVLLERYFASLRLPEVVSDARMPATAK
jgi:hypothetical protein